MSCAFLKVGAIAALYVRGRWRRCTVYDLKGNTADVLLESDGTPLRAERAPTMLRAVYVVRSSEASVVAGAA